MKSELLVVLRRAAILDVLPGIMSHHLQDAYTNRINVRGLLSALETARREFHLYEVEFYDIVAEAYPDLITMFNPVKVDVQSEVAVTSNVWDL